MSNNSLLKTTLAIAMSQLMVSPVTAQTSQLCLNTQMCSVSTGDELREAIVNSNLPNNPHTENIITLTDDIQFLNDSELQPGNAVPFITSDITIEGEGHKIFRRVPGNDEFRIMAVTGESTTLTLNNVTLTGGTLTGYNGGALFIGSSSSAVLNAVTIADNSVTMTGEGSGLGGGVFAAGEIQLTGVTLENNESKKGGGLYASANLVSMVSSTVSGNSADLGGGFYAKGCPITLTNSNISRNSARYQGGGFYAKESSVSITNGTVTANSATNENGTNNNHIGGGFISGESELVLTNSLVSNNSANRYGAFRARNGTVTLIGSTIANNSANETGGIYAGVSSIVSLTNSTLTGNSSNLGVGGIASFESSIILHSSTVTGNSGARVGGINQGHVTNIELINTIVAGNAATNGINELRLRDEAYFVSAYSLIGESSATSAQAIDGLITDANTILATSDGSRPTPLSAILAPLDDNGGSTLTHALAANSPAIDRGSKECPAIDQRGEARNNGRCDIGAFESPENESCFVVKSASGNVVMFCL